MLVLGLDPSLTNFGWALHETNVPAGNPARCILRGRWQTPAKMEFVDRYITQRERLREIVRVHEPDKVGIEFPIFNAMWSEGMYGLFLYSCEALKTESCDVVFWTPTQVKAHARELISRPRGWKMDKVDMVEAAKTNTGGGSWNHNEADAYLVGVLAGRFWQFHEGQIQEDELTPKEVLFFTRVHTFIRGKKAGKTVKTGMIHREDDRFFAWSSKQE